MISCLLLSIRVLGGRHKATILTEPWDEHVPSGTVRVKQSNDINMPPSCQSLSDDRLRCRNSEVHSLQSAVRSLWFVKCDDALSMQWMTDLLMTETRLSHLQLLVFRPVDNGVIGIKPLPQKATIKFLGLCFAGWNIIPASLNCSNHRIWQKKVARTFDAKLQTSCLAQMTLRCSLAVKQLHLVSPPPCGKFLGMGLLVLSP